MLAPPVYAYPTPIFGHWVFVGYVKRTDKICLQKELRKENVDVDDGPPSSDEDEIQSAAAVEDAGAPSDAAVIDAEVPNDSTDDED